jgi:membrane-associated phospholipid phosphatase
MTTITTTQKHSAAAGSLLDPDSSQPAEPARWSQFRPALIRLFIGYAVLTVVLLGIGFLLTHPLNSTVGRWDEHVNEYFARHRTTGADAITSVATSSMNTVPVIAVAALLTGILVLRRRIREAAFLVAALVVEITVFLSVTFVVARPRPSVPRLNATPSTSSFPSGHTAAATVLLVGSAIIVSCCTSKWALRALSALAAVAVAGIVGFARVYRGLHHPTDVFVGALFGLACLGVAALAVRTVRDRAPASIALGRSPETQHQQRYGQGCVVEETTAGLPVAQEFVSRTEAGTSSLTRPSR